MPVEKLPAEILPFVQPNRVIDPNSLAAGARIYDFVNENGDNLGKVVEETVTGNNGIIYKLNNFLTTTGAAAGTYLTTGLAATTVELSVASAAWMAALGISGGALLYQSMPELFNNISDAIFGDFVNGLPVVYFDRYGRLQLEEKTVNKVKNVLTNPEKTVYFGELEPKEKTPELVATLAILFNEYFVQGTHVLLNKEICHNPSDFINFICTYASQFDMTNMWRSGFRDLITDVNEHNVDYYQIMRFYNKKYDSSYMMGAGGSWAYGTRLSLIKRAAFDKVKNHSNVTVALYNSSTGKYDNVTEIRLKFKTSQPYANYWLTGNTKVAIVGENNEDFSFEYIDQGGNRICTDTDFIVTYMGTDQLANTINITDLHDNNQGGNYRFWDTTIISQDGTKYYVKNDPYRYIYSTSGGTEHVTNHGDSFIGSGASIDGFKDSEVFYDICFADPFVPYLYDKDLQPWVNENATLPKESESVSTTYPNWTSQVVQDIGNLLTVTPQQLNPTGDQSVAQSAGDNVDPLKWIEYFSAILNALKPDPTPAPDPSPEPEPTPQPSPDPSPDPGQQPQSDPPSPNTPVEPDPTPIIDPTLIPISSSKLFTVYNPTANQLDQLGGYLWSQSFITAIEKIWQDPLSAIISLRRVYATPTSSSTQNIILGYLDSGVTGVKVVDSQFVTKSCGYVNVEEVMHNATDYSPYSQAHIYLPFIGIQEIDIDDIMNGRLTVRYTFDMYTGVCLAELIVLRSDLTPEKMLYTFSGNAAQEVPLTSATAQVFFSTLMQMGGSALAIAGGGAVGIAAGANMIGHSLTHEMIHIARSGNLSANAGIMGNRYPQLILSNRNRYDANSYNTIYGYPANKTVYLGNCSGFIQVKAINLKTFATQPEKEEIETLLKSGVIF